ncbi:hypothetical protein GCM10027290_13150 [Micromonospora sonneratiae]|uniref:Glycosyltransferase n=1 Tax=Micromonospora sonneratiae TaxID=1184706 RepID=A0ABW3YJV5_9ACTN
MPGPSGPGGPVPSPASRLLDVVVPAHDEETLIGGCLRAVLRDATGIDLRIIVVANGCTDGTADAVRAVGKDLDTDPPSSVAGFAPPSRRQILLVEMPVAGKAGALNAGDRHRRGCPTIYLDADTVLTPGTLDALLTALEAGTAPRLVAPRPVLVRPADRLGRDFAAVWLNLPAVAGQVVGAGCYAVNVAGRARWDTFPELTADDAYVRSRFTPDERLLVGPGGFLLVLPRWRELIGVADRWRRGNSELTALPDPGPAAGSVTASPAAGTGRNLAVVAARPGLWPHLPGFLLVNFAGRLRRRRRWARADGLRAAGPPGPRPGIVPTVDVVVTHRHPAALDRCLASLRSSWARLHVTVVQTAPVRDPAVLATAVEQAGRPGHGDYLLLVDSTVELAAGALDELLALATRFPAAGLYAGRPVHRRPDQVRVARRPPGGLLLVDRALWHRLSGPTGRQHHWWWRIRPDRVRLDLRRNHHRSLHRDFFRDLHRRAGRLGATPMYTPSAGYRQSDRPVPPEPSA